jgi:glutamate racemase
VPLAEEGWTDGEIAQLIARRYLEPLKESNIDVLILGCTHYPLLKSTIQKVMSEEVALVDSAEETALEIEKTLKEGDISNEGSYFTQREFYLTDVSETFIAIAERFLGERVERVEQVEI